jgi:hypothetical protein
MQCVTKMTASEERDLEIKKGITREISAAGHSHFHTNFTFVKHRNITCNAQPNQCAGQEQNKDEAGRRRKRSKAQGSRSSSQQQMDPHLHSADSDYIVAVMQLNAAGTVTSTVCKL